MIATETPGSERTPAVLVAARRRLAMHHLVTMRRSAELHLALRSAAAALE